MNILTQKYWVKNIPQLNQVRYHYYKDEEKRHLGGGGADLNPALLVNLKYIVLLYIIGILCPNCLKFDKDGHVHRQYNP